MAGDLFSSALSGMTVAQMGLVTAEHNIANANTPGYSRQQLVVGTRNPQPLGGFFLGQGVDVAGIKRMYDGFLNTQVRLEQTQASYLSTYLSSMKQIDNLIADPTAGASPAIQEFFGAVNGVANAPDSIPARQTMLSSAQFMINRFQAIDQRLTDIANSLVGQIGQSVNQINSYASQIAALNASIKRLSASASNNLMQPNDLLDQREQLINQLNQEIKVSVQIQSDGTASVFIGNGQALVINEMAMTLRAVPSAQDPSRVDIAYVNGQNVVRLQTSSLQGGSLGAFLAFRDQSLEPARNALGRVALGLASKINEQNKLGQDLKGLPGGDLFKVAAPRVERAVGNSGAANAMVSISDVGAITTSDYQLSYDGTNYLMLRVSDNVVTNLGPTLPQTVDGMTIAMAGAPAIGDTFYIRPAADAARDIALLTNDPTRIAAATPVLATASTANTGRAQISAGAVDANYSTAMVTPPLTLSYNSLSNELTGFPLVDVTVTSNGVPTVFPAGSPVTFTDGATYSFGGASFTITGMPNNGDQFTIGANQNGIGDNRNILLMAALQTRNIMANGSTTFQGIYGQLVGEVGAKTHELDVTSQAQNAMVTQIVAAQQAVSGVNLDEEAANLMRYQKAYQAAAKAMQIANSMFDAIIAIGR